MSLARRSRRSLNSSSSTASRKRKLARNSTSGGTNSKQPRLDFAVSSEELSLFDIDDNMSSSSSPSSSLGSRDSNNHKISLTNSHAAKPGATGSNHSKKPGAGKKIVIKNLKVRPHLPENYSEAAWFKLKEAVLAVYSSSPISYSLEELYKAVENSCSHGMAAQLYDNLSRVCRDHVTSLLPQFKSGTMSESQFLIVVDRQWSDFCRQMIMIRSIFLYLDRTYAVPHQSVPALWEMGIELFGSVIVRQSFNKERVVSGILSTILRERTGDSVDKGLLKNLLRMLVDLQMYQEVFELEFLRETEILYHTESLRIMRDNEFTLPDYLSHVKRRLAQEEDRILQYLHKTTRKPLLLCVEKQLIGEHQQEILDKGFESLLESSRYSDLGLLFQLFSRFKDGIPMIYRAFGEFIKKSGSVIISDHDRDKSMVQELLDLKSKVDRIIQESFQNHQKFHDAVRDSFESVINRRQNKPAELVAKYLDVRLRSGNKEWTDEELEQLLDRVLVLFRYIHGKDVFEAFYKKDLAKRLLLGKSASFDVEKSMLLKFKQECGANFTSKLEGMFRDIELSKEMMTSFKHHLQSSSRVSGSVDLAVSVLTMGYWPSYPPMDILLPPELGRYLDVFKEFYLRKHSGRKVQWQSSLGHCVLKANFSPAVKELQVSLFQSVVLLLFNDRDTLDFCYIREATQIEDAELRRTLQSLSLGKARVLTKHPKGINVLDSDQFSFNADFKHKLFRIKINQVQLKETQEENTATNERVFQDRQYQVDAAIVRIMKMRRNLSHNLLVSECLGQLRFDIRPSDLKKRIESLIDRDYIRRSQEASSVYEYIA